jgi:hypothetical protein
MTQAQRDGIASPAAGLLIYQTNNTPGYYYYNAGWQSIGTAGPVGANAALSNLTTTAINVDLLPSTTGTLNFGSSTKTWHNLYLSDDVYLQGIRFLSSRGSLNAFAGFNSGNSISTGAYNAALGAFALFSDSTGNQNTAAGSFSLYYNGSGSNNSANGYSSLYTNNAGSGNTSNGAFSMYYNTSGNDNTVSGNSALYFNTLGSQNTTTGSYAMTYNTTGNNNAAAGFASLYWNSTGGYNNASGSSALYNNTEGNYNTGAGAFSLYSNQTNSGNTAVGYDAGYFNTSNSTFLGANAYSGSSLTNVTAIGYGAYGTGDNSVKVGNTSVTSIGGYAGWTTFPSDKRYKKNVKEDVPGLEFIKKLRPVTYNMDAEGITKAMKPVFPNPTTDIKNGFAGNRMKSSISEDEKKALAEKALIKFTGFIAQEVEQAAKDIDYNFSGVDAPKNDKDFYGIRYAEFVVPLVKAVQEVDSSYKAEITLLKQQMNELKEIIKELRTNQIGGSLISSSAWMKQNTPNPFNGSTTIEYFIPADSKNAKIAMINAKGQQLKYWNIDIGKGTVSFNSGTLAAGSYAYSLIVDGITVSTRKMIIGR